MRLITEFDVNQMRNFKCSLFQHYLAMDASLQLLKNRHLTTNTIMARLALQLNELISASQDLDFETCPSYPLFILPKIRSVRDSLVSLLAPHESVNYLELDHYTLWSDFRFRDRDDCKPLFTLDSSRTDVVRSLLGNRVVKPNLYQLLTGKVGSLVTECQRIDDLLHSFAKATFHSMVVLGYVRSDIEHLIGTLERPSGRPRVRFVVVRSETVRSFRNIVHLMYRNRAKWVSPEEPDSNYYYNPSRYYRSCNHFDFSP